MGKLRVEEREFENGIVWNAASWVRVETVALLSNVIGMLMTSGSIFFCVIEGVNF